MKIARTTFALVIIIMLYSSTVHTQSNNSFTSIGPSGSVVTHIEINPANNNVMYAVIYEGYENRKIYKSTNSIFII